MTSIDLILLKYKQAKDERINFDQYYQELHDYFDIEASDITSVSLAGSELTISKLYDPISLEAADIFGAGIMNYMTPAASIWMHITNRDKRLRQIKAVQNFYEEIREEVTFTLNGSNFNTVMPDFYKKSGTYGTSTVFQEMDNKDYVRFYSLDVKSSYFLEDYRQKASEYFIEFEYTFAQAVGRFGEKNLHPEMVRKHKEGKSSNNKHKFILYIGPNSDRNHDSFLTKQKKIYSAWIDVQNKHITQEGGFDSLPAMTHRFYKRDGVSYGYSPAMKALPAVRTYNAMIKTQLRAAMKATDPPIAYPSNAFMMPLNMNPRGANIYNRANLGKDDIFPIGNYGNFQFSDPLVEKFEQRIRSMMFTDVFLAFQNITKTMTVPEVMEKVTERMTLLGPAVGRYMSAVLDPIIERTVDILGQMGRLPEPPPELLQGDGNYDIEYVSALAVAQKQGELNALQNALALSGNIAQFHPSALDKIDSDKAIDSIFDITGASTSILRDDEQVKAIRENRAEQEAAEQEAALLGQGADIALKATQASINARQAQL